MDDISWGCGVEVSEEEDSMLGRWMTLVGAVVWKSRRRRACWVGGCR